MKKLTPDEYMQLLLERREEHYAQHGKPRPGFPALPEWFIRDGDEHLVDMNAIEAQNARHEPPTPATKPRHYRPATYWEAELARIQARMDHINGIKRHDTTDPAAYGGIGIPQTARQRAKYGARIDKAAAEHVKLDRRRTHAQHMLTKARAREATP